MIEKVIENTVVKLTTGNPIEQIAIAVSLMVFIGIVVTILVCALGAICQKILNSPKLYPIRFRLTFGIWPSNQSDYTARSIEQKIIDRRLGLLAQVFIDACREQDQLLNELSQAKTGTKADLKNHRRTKDLVRQTKQTFWTAHGLVQYFHYQTRDRAVHYTTFPIGGLNWPDFNEDRPMNSIRRNPNPFSA